MNLRELQDLKDEIDKARREAAREEGAGEQTRKALKDEFGCVDLTSSDSILVQLRQRIETLTRDFQQKKREFEERRTEQLGDDA